MRQKMFDKILAILSWEFNLLAGFYEQKQENKFIAKNENDEIN